MTAKRMRRLFTSAWHRPIRPACVLATLALLASGCGEDPPGGGDPGTGDGTTWEDTETDDKPDLVCLPGETRCGGDTTLETCAGTGLEWEPSVCPQYEVCVACEEGDQNCVAACKGPCQSEDELPSSAGCSFMANRMIHVEEEEPDGLIVGNPNSGATATVQLYEIPEGKRTEVAVGDPVEIAPGESADFLLDTNFIDLIGYSRFRTGGNYRLESDIPVIAYQHSPWEAIKANDASLLLPEEALRTDYVVTTYASAKEQDPSYFTVIAIEDDTEITWYPPVATAGNGFPIPFVPSGGKGTLSMGRFDNARIAASAEATPNHVARDVSGTVIRSNKPIWVVGGAKCAEVPVNKDGCDHLQELLLPIDYWGKSYVAAPSPKRADEPHIWRVYAGAKDGVSITSDNPMVDDIELDRRGDFVEFSVPQGTAFVLEGDGPFMPVQYLASYLLSGKIGDPAMYQMVPVDQYLARYVFVTGLDYDLHYAQITRHKGAADIVIDGEVVTGYYAVGDFEVADWPISEGAHVAESDEEFGVVQIGYTIGGGADGDKGDAQASYAYPGGLKVEAISIP